MTIDIDNETTSDAAAIAALITEAFATARVASGTEAEIVTRLRADGKLLLSLVARDGGTMVGHLAASPATIGGERGWALIGPLAVDPAHQGRGIGTALMHAALKRLAGMGERGVVLVGNPDYYRRFGFTPDCGVDLPGVPPANVMARPLAGGQAKGRLVCHPALMPQDNRL